MLKIITINKSSNSQFDYNQQSRHIFDDDEHYQEEITDLNNFFKYLLVHQSNRNYPDNVNATKVTDLPAGDGEALSWEFFSLNIERLASLFQVLFLILVFMCVVFICKCNKLMFACRNVIVKPQLISLDKIYNDKMTFFDYVCISCKRFKRKRARRNKR